MNISTRFVGIAAVLLVSMLCIGCGSSHHNVSGTVKLKDGTLLKNGKVTMIGEKGESFAEIKPDGTYTMGTLAVGDGVPPGTYKVAVESVSEPTDKNPYGKSIVDSKYNDPERSGLTLVVDGNEEYNIEVEKGK